MIKQENYDIEILLSRYMIRVERFEDTKNNTNDSRDNRNCWFKDVKRKKAVKKIRLVQSYERQ